MVVRTFPNTGPFLSQGDRVTLHPPLVTPDPPPQVQVWARPTFAGCLSLQVPSLQLPWSQPLVAP